MDGEIDHDELRSLLEDDDARIVDVRRPAAYARGHVPGSENVPLDRLVDDVERFADADRVVTMCPHGRASVKAARLIAAYEEFDGRVESFEPGLSQWEGPVESGSPATDGGDASDESGSAPGDAGPTDAATGGDGAANEGADDEGPTAPF